MYVKYCVFLFHASKNKKLSFRHANHDILCWPWPPGRELQADDPAARLGRVAVHTSLAGSRNSACSWEAPFRGPSCAGRSTGHLLTDEADSSRAAGTHELGCLFLGRQIYESQMKLISTSDE